MDIEDVNDAPYSPTWIDKDKVSIVLVAQPLMNDQLPDPAAVDVLHAGKADDNVVRAF